MPVRAKLLRIYGDVQGVNYRESMCQMAKELGVQGWVRNRGDGSVEAFVQGEPAPLEDILQWARLGSPRSRVERVASDDRDPDPSLNTFQRRETA